MSKQLDVIGLGTNALEQIATLQQLPTSGNNAEIEHSLATHP